ncbi:MAG: helix-turn-helix domain-containing protein [Chloroflexi bacterium]|nr:helix-turn-helix domain-containing protein [Chloroflexota bacterium]
MAQSGMIELAKGLRKELGMTQREFAERVGVTRVTVNRWDNGRAQPSELAVKAISRLAEASSNCKHDGFEGEGPSQLKEQPGARGCLLPPGLPDNQAPEAGGLKDMREPECLEEETRTNVLKKSLLFSHLGRDHLVELSRQTEALDVPAGQFLFMEGDPVDRCYVLASGTIKVLKHSPSGRDFVKAIYGPGETLGNVLLDMHMQRALSGQAVIDSKLLVIKRRDFVSFLRRHPELRPQILMRMLNLAAKRHQAASVRLGEMATERAGCRLSRALLALFLNFGPTIPVGRHEIAGIAGTTTETASRFVSSLRKTGVVRPLRGKVIVLEPEKLRALAEVSLS